MKAMAAADLVKRCADQPEGDIWDEFLRRFQSRLRAGVYRALARCDVDPNSHEREDLIQEVFCRLLERRCRCLRLCRGEGESSVGAYLGRVAENVVVDRIRAAAAAKRGRDQLVDRGPESRFDPLVIAADRRPSPEERLIARERVDAFLHGLRQALGAASPQRDWQIFCMAVVEGRSSREICLAIGGGLKPSTVDSLIHRLRRRLARRGLALPRRDPSTFDRAAQGVLREPRRRLESDVA